MRRIAVYLLALLLVGCWKNKQVFEMPIRLDPDKSEFMSENVEPIKATVGTNFGVAIDKIDEKLITQVASRPVAFRKNSRLAVVEMETEDLKSLVMRFRPVAFGKSQTIAPPESGWKISQFTDHYLIELLNHHNATGALGRTGKMLTVDRKPDFTQIVNLNPANYAIHVMPERPTMNQIRLAAARFNCDYLLLVFRENEITHWQNMFSPLYVTVAGLFVVPGTTIGSRSGAAWMMMDVRTGYGFFMDEKMYREELMIPIIFERQGITHLTHSVRATLADALVKRFFTSVDMLKIEGRPESYGTNNPMNSPDEARKLGLPAPDLNVVSLPRRDVQSAQPETMDRYKKSFN